MDPRYIKLLDPREINLMDPRLYSAATTGTNLDLFTQFKDKLGDERTGSGYTVLHIASHFGQLEAVNHILSLNQKLLLTRSDQTRESALHLAVRGGHSSVVRALIDCAKELPPRRCLTNVIVAKEEMLRFMNSGDNFTALHEAVRYHHVDIVKMLIEEDPDYSYRSVCLNGRVRISRHVQQCVNTAGWNETPLYLAARRGFYELVDVIVKNCKSPAFDGPDHKTALHGAVISNSKECVQILLSWKPSLREKKDSYKQTPLHYVAHLGHAELVRLLVLENVHVAYQRDSSGNTALHIAASQGHVSVMKELILCCPDSWDMLGDKGQNILHMAVEHQQENVIEYILQDCQIIDNLVNRRDFYFNTPLHLLSNSNFVVPELIKHPKADKGVSNFERMTLLDLVTYINVNDESTPIKTKIAEELKGVGATSGLPCKISINQLEIEEKEESKRWRDQRIKELWKRAQTHIVVTTLIATITFAAGFTMPGGYIQSGGTHEGMSVLAKSPAFQAFIISDVVALLLSTTATLMYFVASIHIVRESIFWYLRAAVLLNLFAMLAMTVAFVTGIYAVLATSPALAIFVCVTGSCFFLFYIVFVLRYVSLIRMF